MEEDKETMGLIHRPLGQCKL